MRALAGGFNFDLRNDGGSPDDRFCILDTNGVDASANFVRFYS